AGGAAARMRLEPGLLRPPPHRPPHVRDERLHVRPRAPALHPRAVGLPRAVAGGAGVARPPSGLRPPGLARPEPARARGPARELLAHRPRRERELGARPGRAAAPAAAVALPG